MIETVKFRWVSGDLSRACVLLIIRRVVRELLGILHRRLLPSSRDDDMCQRLMTARGVGPVAR
jgi:hypothetical protein